jgi:hypothetical protein
MPLAKHDFMDSRKNAIIIFEFTDLLHYRIYCTFLFVYLIFNNFLSIFLMSAREFQPAHKTDSHAGCGTASRHNIGPTAAGNNQRQWRTTTQCSRRLKGNHVVQPLASSTATAAAPGCWSAGELFFGINSSSGIIFHFPIHRLPLHPPRAAQRPRHRRRTLAMFSSDATIRRRTTGRLLLLNSACSGPTAKMGRHSRYSFFKNKDKYKTNKCSMSISFFCSLVHAFALPMSNRFLLLHSCQHLQQSAKSRWR